MFLQREWRGSDCLPVPGGWNSLLFGSFSQIVLSKCSPETCQQIGQVLLAFVENAELVGSGWPQLFTATKATYQFARLTIIDKFSKYSKDQLASWPIQGPQPANVPPIRSLSAWTSSTNSWPSPSLPFCCAPSPTFPMHWPILFLCLFVLEKNRRYSIDCYYFWKGRKNYYSATLMAPQSPRN